MSSSTQRRPIRLNPARTARVGAVVMATLLASVVVTQRSSSAFSASTDQDVSVGASTMKLTASDTTPFQVANMVPGESASKCVEVTYTGSAPQSKLTEVKLYGTSSGDLAPLDATVSMGPAGSTCPSPTGAKSIGGTGKLPGLNALTNFDTGLGTGWTPEANGSKRAFVLKVTLPAATGNEAQGKSAAARLTWEVQSIPSSS